MLPIKYFRVLLAGALLLALSACTTIVSVEEPPADDLRGEVMTLSYFDSPVFESTMRHMLASRADLVEVKVFRSFDVNDLPEVFEKWIEHCSKNGGKINMVDEASLPESRGMAQQVAKFAFEYFYDRYKQKMKDRWFDPVNQYDINIIYSSEDGAVKSLEFVRIID